MSDLSGSKSFSRGTRWFSRHRVWLVLGLTLLLVIVVRVRLREMPLERDEGEYAYAGQLILHGVPPYKDAYNMKLPGTYAAYALVMAVFGQTPAGIHIGLLPVNLASILLMFFIGRRLLDEVTGLVAAVAFALLSLSPSVLGLCAHATHFVVLPALAGILLLLKALRPASGARDKPSTLNPQLSILALSGLLFGIAFLMKQHGIFFGLFGLVYLLWLKFAAWLEAREAAVRPSLARYRSAARSANPGSAAGSSPHPPVRHSFSDGGSTCNPQPSAFAAYLAGWVLPYAATCLILWLCGVFPQFWFWTVSYASKYASAIPLVNGPEALRVALKVVVGPNLPLWLLPWAGALLIWWDERLSPERSSRRSGQASALNLPSTLPHPRFFLVAFLFCSVGSVSLGFYFREHYFITLLPALALLSGVAVSRALHLLRHDRSIELFLALPVVVLAVIAAFAPLIGHGALWFGLSPAEAMRSACGTTLFSQAASAANTIKSAAPRDARLGVLGSEPEIYFLSRLRSATGNIYMYPLMERQPFALKMQEDMIAELERANPEFMVYLDDNYSWLRQENSERKLQDWWDAYWPSRFDVVASLEIDEDLARGADTQLPDSVTGSTDSPAPATKAHLFIFKRKAQKL